MSDKLPHLIWLRAFEASARHLSFTQAANELNLTQAAISKQVKLLELYLREQLFIRKPRSLLLTRTGEAYLPKVRDAFERLAAGTREVFGNRKAGALTVRSAVGFSVNWLGPRLGGFTMRYPEKQIRIISSVWSDEFDKERFDLDIQYGTGKWPGFKIDRLTWETVTPVCSPALLEGPNALRRPEDLANHSLLHVLGYEEGWGNWLQLAGASKVDSGRGIKFDTSLIAFEVAASGHGVALGRSSMANKELAAGRLVAPFDVHLPLKESFYLISPIEGTGHADTDLFRDWLLAEVAAERNASQSAASPDQER
ncbi:MAG: transcriptional regulator GcvA [Rhizobiaceae bacterium]